ncbi:TetR/AcrR family transcriptional regulator [Saccharothrix sp. ST-888]|uniref:TetR/AcrR family transcriptional regulator n=1 Tax=Saccharothrix sp. ST-888 TaxID=1427391 RepID=UPI0005ECADF6|nr:TetR/AcrR family transcriptional regulator [Saccharothrix sp. ST-888]KJK55773.1 TetR family transcriptional regulator [Saccharothrix sp. ST-888]
MPAEEERRGKSAKQEKAQVSLWERIERPAPPPRATLSAHRIAAVAVAIADAEGIDAVTMRRLATELGVAPMATYRHVSGKGELLELMVDFVYGELALPDPAVGWRDAMRTLAERTRAMLLDHPWMSRGDVLALTPNQLALTESGLAVLDGLGLDTDTMMAVFRTVAAYVHGSVTAEINLLRLMQDQGWSNGDETRAGLASRMTWLMDTGRYPAYRRYAGEATRKDDREWQFGVGLDCVLDGIAARMGI